MSKKDITLNQFGFSFQMKTITLLLTDVNFFQQIYDILEDDYFESEANEWIVKTIKDYFEKYRTLPTLEAMKVLLDDVSSDVLKMSVVDNLREAHKHIGDTDLDFVSNDFCTKGNVPVIPVFIFLDKLESIRKFPPAPGIRPTPTSTKPV